MNMADQIFFRPYVSSDMHDCCNLMQGTWLYEQIFPNMKKPINAYKFMLSSYLLESDYTKVAVRFDNDKNEEILGFIFGQTIKVNFFKCMQYFLFSFVSTVLWLCGQYGNRGDIFKLLQKMKQDEYELFADFTSKDAHLHLFFTSDKARGLGIGKKLFADFENYCKEKNNSKIVLVTDTDCNYGFYDHIGFNCVKTQQGCFGVPQTELEKMQTKTFVYAKNI